MELRPAVFVVLGPTGVGKTAYSLELAHKLSAPIISADSRQVFREIPIGTAAPSAEEQVAVPHYFIGDRSIHDSWSASIFEQEAVRIVERHIAQGENVVVAGGSMMYVDALCHGIDQMPDVKPEIRSAVWQRFESEGLALILEELRELDPIYYERVDRQNYKRVLHGYEMCLSTGRPFSSFHTGTRQERPWHIVKIGINRDREALYERIDQRVDVMLEHGLLEEARAVYPYRHLNALNTVGYKELFMHFDGTIDLDEAIRLIKRNSRHYARKQLTWWQRDTSIDWKML